MFISSKNWKIVLAAGLVLATAECFAAEAIAAKQDVRKQTTTQPSSQPSTQPSSKFKTPRDLQSYSYGVETARNFKKIGLDMNLELMMEGMRDVTEGRKLQITDTDIRNLLIDFSGQARVYQTRARLMLAEDNKKAGEAFLAENKTKEGVVTLPSGLQYKVLKAGEGRIPTATDSVEVEYHAYLIDGTEFDSTTTAGQPMILKVSDGNIIAGFREAMRLMPVGSQWKLYIPSRLGYLDRGLGRLVGPNSVLIYDVKLLSAGQPIQNRRTDRSQANGARSEP